MLHALPISAAIICLNEQEWIGVCIESLKSCAEIIIVDSGSTDHTLTIIADYQARGYPIRLFHQKWLGYARQKQFACDQATQAWVLSIDADESLDANLQRALPELIGASAEIVGWRLRRNRKLFGVEPKLAAYTRPAKIFRLYRNGQAKFDPDDLVHEGLRTGGTVLTCKTGILRHEGAFMADKQLGKEASYARLKAEQKMRDGKKPSLTKLIFSPLWRFLRTLFMDRLILCGAAGLIEAQTQATYAFLTEAIHLQLWRAAQTNKR